MKFKRTLFLLGFCFIVGNYTSVAQNYSNEKIKALLKKKRDYNKEYGFGYRIQLYNGNEVTAKKISAKFKTSFPEVKVFLKYIEPEWKIQVGNYKTRIGADKALLEFQKKFNSAIVVPLG